MAWGENGFGELGNGGETESDVPVPVSLSLPPEVTVTAISADDGPTGDSLALLSNGTVMAWGEQQLWPARKRYEYWPRNVRTAVSLQRDSGGVVGLANVTAISAGSTHSLALRATARLWPGAITSMGRWARAASLVRKNVEQKKRPAAAVR